MLKILRSLYPALYYLVKAKSFQIRGKTFSKVLRNQYLQNWSKDTLNKMGVSLAIVGKPMRKPGILVGNHMSYLDIPVVCHQVPALFLAKAEISRWPLVGNAARFLDTVFIDRKSKSSRQDGIDRIVEKVLKQKERIVVFPSGTTSIDENLPWRMGIFRVSKEYNFPIQAFRISYEPRALSAYTGKDVFLPHMYRLLKTTGIKARIEFLPPQFIKNIDKDMARIKEWCMG